MESGPTPVESGKGSSGAWNSYIGASVSSGGAQISCSGACSSYSRACVLTPLDKGFSPLETPEALSFSRGLAFSPSGATTLPHFKHACVPVEGVVAEVFYSAMCICGGA